jgi:hypothetical protein
MNADDTIDERNDNGGERIAKAIARAGLASRREANSERRLPAGSGTQGFPCQKGVYPRSPTPTGDPLHHPPRRVCWISARILAVA